MLCYNKIKMLKIGGEKMKIRKKQFLPLLELLIENDVIPFGEIKVFILNPVTKKYELYHYCGLGTFTGIGYQYLISGMEVDKFIILSEIPRCIFYLS